MPTPQLPGNTAPVKYITICSKTPIWVNGQRSPIFPLLSLNGQCLQDAGFKINQVLDVSCEPGKLTITIAKVQHYTALKNLLKKGRTKVV